MILIFKGSMIRSFKFRIFEVRDPNIRRSKDLEMRRFEDLKIQRSYEDLKIRRFEDLKIQKFEDHRACIVFEDVKIRIIEPLVINGLSYRLIIFLMIRHNLKFRVFETWVE